MEGLEPSYRRHAKSEKKMCKHCKSTAHSSVQHGKHYKGFADEKKEALEKKHMKMFDNDADKKHRKASSEYDGGHAVQAGKGAYNANSTTMGTPALSGFGISGARLANAGQRSMNQAKGMGDEPSLAHWSPAAHKKHKKSAGIGGLKSKKA